MELTSQDKEIGTPSSFCHNPSNVVSSSKAPHQINTPQTLDHHRPLYHQNQLNQHQSHKPTRDSDLSPGLAPITATRAMNTASTPTRPISRSSPPPPSPPVSSTTTSRLPVRYRECLKNHAASMGAHVLDGCGEFMAKGEEATPEALICAACGCHRNFHRKEIDGETQYINSYYKINGHRNPLPPPQPPSTSLHPPQPPSLHHHHRHHHGFSISTSTAPIAPIMMNFGGGGGGSGQSSSDDLHIFQSHMHGQTSMQQASSKKRFRTKFSQEQKKKMMEFAEKIGWKIQKPDDQEVQQFCSQVGVKRKVFKVWMHNNKQAMKRKQM